MEKTNYVTVDWELVIKVHADDIPESAMDSIRGEISFMINNGHTEGTMETDIEGYK